MWELNRTETWESNNWCFWTVGLEKTLESPLDCKEINQSILKEINPEYSLEGLMLKLKLQYFGHLMQRTDSLEKTLTLGKNWRQDEKGTTEDEMTGWHYWLDGHVFEQLWELVMDREAWRAVVHGSQIVKGIHKVSRIIRNGDSIPSSLYLSSCRGYFLCISGTF